MNLIDAYITKILSEPQFKSHQEYEWWEVDIECEDMGGKQTTKRVFETKEEAEKLKVGDVFQH